MPKVAYKHVMVNPQVKLQQVQHLKLERQQLLRGDAADFPEVDVVDAQVVVELRGEDARDQEEPNEPTCGRSAGR